MNLDNPITITPPSFTRKDGTVRTFNPITFTKLDVTLEDSASRKIVLARIAPLRLPLVLWSGETYDVAGDYTQAQAENRIRELLGDNPVAVLEGLFIIPRNT